MLIDMIRHKAQITVNFLDMGPEKNARSLLTTFLHLFLVGQNFSIANKKLLIERLINVSFCLATQLKVKTNRTTKCRLPYERE